MSEQRKVWHLRRIDLFASMTVQEIVKLGTLLDDYLVPAHVELLGSRQRDQIYLVKAGAVRLSVGEGRRAVTVALLGPGRLFGLSSGLGEDDPTVAATTLVPSYLCVATWAKLVEVLIRHPAVMLKVTGSLAQQVFQIESWSERLGVVSPRERLTELLVELGEEFGESSDGGRRIPFRLARTDLARMIGVSRETVSRLMVEFERTGWVRLEDGFLVVYPVPTGALDTGAAGTGEAPTFDAPGPNEQESTPERTREPGCP